VYPGSGNDTALAVLAEVSKHGRGILGTAHQNHDTNIAKARDAGAVYLFEPTILHWEHRRTEWSGKPNRITLRMELYDTATGKLITDAVLESNSTWWTLGGDLPQDLLAKTIAPFVERVYATDGAVAP